MGSDDLEVFAPLIERNPNGTLSSFFMPPPLTRGGYKVAAYRMEHGHSLPEPFIVLRGALLTSSTRDGAPLVEAVVHGQSSWVDDEGDRIKVAALQLSVQSTTFLYEKIVLLAYMGEPGATDYTDFPARAEKDALPYWPKNPGRAPQVAGRGSLPDNPILVEVVIRPEWDTPHLVEG